MSQNKIKVMNRRLDKSATVLADSFVDFKRRASTALEMSGWLNVRVIKAKGFEDVTVDMVDNNAGTIVTVQSFQYIDFSNSILIVNLADKPYSYHGRNIQVVDQGHDNDDIIDIHES